MNKKRLFSLVLPIVLLAALAACLSGCATGGEIPEPDKNAVTRFEGTWSNGKYTNVFAGNTISHYYKGKFRWTGTFSFMGNELDCWDISGKRVAADFAFVDDYLVLAKPSVKKVSSWAYGNFKKE
jgi:hypothetical protein